ncbi:MAG TPA: carboxypeptidase-like regulatory domain-containing protein, partial [Gemmatimonadales bacterium]|nr:carboxypeptidase-like regulatory domain-containing protein [Gemmatimonadales bacterium]
MRNVALAAVVLGVGAPALVAQGSTGKIEGIIKDAGGQPVANAQVRILGTAFATTANTAGYYFFNSVPAGSYDIRVNY